MLGKTLLLLATSPYIKEKKHKIVEHLNLKNPREDLSSPVWSNPLAQYNHLDVPDDNYYQPNRRVKEVVNQQLVELHFKLEFPRKTIKYCGG
jgi:hypothetical protein